MDLCNHPAIISIFWMCSHLGFFPYTLSFHSLRSRRLEVVGAREKGRERGRYARGTQAKFSSLMCINFHQIPVLCFPINDEEEEETRHNTAVLFIRHP